MTPNKQPEWEQVAVEWLAKESVRVSVLTDLQTLIKEIISSRDTYWKERVEEIYGHFSWCQECAEGPMCKDALAIKDNLK